MAPTLRALHLFVRWLGSLVWLALTVCAAVAFALGNFLVSWQAFELIGFEDLPLAEVPLTGPVAVALGVGTAPLAAVYALGLTAVMGFLVGTTVKIVWEMLAYFSDWRRLRRSEEQDSRRLARECLGKLEELGLRLVVPLSAAVLAVRMDVALFVLRARALLTDAADISEFLGLLPDPVVQLGALLAGFTVTFAWGYMACVVGAALAVEHAFERSASRWEGLSNNIQALIDGDATRPSGHGAGVTDATATPVLREPERVQPTVPEPAETRATQPETPVLSAATWAPEPVPGPEPPAADLPPVATPRAGSREVDVVVGPGQMRRVALDMVESSRDFVRDSSGRQWFDRQYYESVMGPIETAQEEKR